MRHARRSLGRLRAHRKTIVVTGASTGIGYATSLALAKAGYHVFAGVRSLSAGEPLVKAASSLSGKITLMRAGL